MSPRRMMASLLLVFQVAGCYRWSPDQLTPDQAIQGRSVLVVRHERLGSNVDHVDTVGTPWVRNDSLFGIVADAAWAVPLEAVTEIRTESDSLIAKRIADWGANAALAAGVITGVLLVVAFCQAGDSDCSGQSTTYSPIKVTFWSQ